MAGEPVFIDTNALIYANQDTSPLHAPALARIDSWLNDGTPLWISRQVLREYLVVMSRPGLFQHSLSIEDLSRRVQDFSRVFNVADEGADTTLALLKIIQDHKVSGRNIHDANIVATMLASGVRRLLTANVKDFQIYSSLIALEPLTGT
ncbi:MAG: PIN domain-containing protein [Rhodospirillales bacterium]|nr:MAG: PIN domain-containing protein [Rhodospirillales bacterium]